MYKVFFKYWYYAVALVFMTVIIASVLICIKVDALQYGSVSVRHKKKYSFEVAEKVRYFDYEFLERELFTFTSCRIKKLRRGAFTFGAFNVLEMEDLVINIPVSKADKFGPLAADNDSVESNTFVRVFSSFRTMGKRRFSGIEINHLTINKYLTTNQYVQIEAVRAESRFKKKIKLEQCTISINAQEKVRVSDAFIELKPDPKVIYREQGIKSDIEL